MVKLSLLILSKKSWCSIVSVFILTLFDVPYVRNCAFVNFTSITNPIKAIDRIKGNFDYANLRIAHGKDPCANPPPAGPQTSKTRLPTHPTPVPPLPRNILQHPTPAQL